MKADVQLPAALWHRSIMPWGQSLQAPSWPSEEHGECLEAAPTQAALHSLDIPLWEWDGDYEAACPLTRSWGGSAQHSSVAGSVLSLAAQLHPGCATVPMGLQHGWDHAMSLCNAITMLLPRQNTTSCHSCSCKRGMEEEGLSVHIIRVQ